MRKISIVAYAEVLAFVCSTTYATADVLDCTQPVRLGDSAKTLPTRFGNNAKLEDFIDDGGSGKAVVMFPADPTRRLDVKFYEGSTYETIEVHAGANGWLVRGVHLGSTLADVEAANGGPFSITAWGSDVGGFANFGDGKLGKAAGTCQVAIRFDFRGSIRPPDDLQGEEKRLRSSDSKLRVLSPVVFDIILTAVERPNAPRSTGPDRKQ